MRGFSSRPMKKSSVGGASFGQRLGLGSDVQQLTQLTQQQTQPGTLQHTPSRRWPINRASPDVSALTQAVARVAARREQASLGKAAGWARKGKVSCLSVFTWLSQQVMEQLPSPPLAQLPSPAQLLCNANPPGSIQVEGEGGREDDGGGDERHIVVIYPAAAGQAGEGQ